MTARMVRLAARSIDSSTARMVHLTARLWLERLACRSDSFIAARCSRLSIPPDQYCCGLWIIMTVYADERTYTYVTERFNREIEVRLSLLLRRIRACILRTCTLHVYIHRRCKLALHGTVDRASSMVDSGVVAWCPGLRRRVLRIGAAAVARGPVLESNSMGQISRRHLHEAEDTRSVLLAGCRYMRAPSCCPAMTPKLDP